MEIRSFAEERAMPTITNERTIEGYAIVFNKESRIILDRQSRRAFIEVIKPEAVQQADFRNWDIKALVEHDKSRLLARSFNGAGTLTLSIDNYGVRYRFDAPKTVEGDNAVEMIQRRDIFGSSFAYTTDEKQDVIYKKRADGLLVREVGRIKRMFDISIVTDPAYFGTDVNVRSLDSYFEIPNEDYKKQIEELRRLRIQ